MTLTCAAVRGIAPEARRTLQTPRAANPGLARALPVLWVAGLGESSGAVTVTTLAPRARVIAVEPVLRGTEHMGPLKTHFTVIFCTVSSTKRKPLPYSDHNGLQ